MKQTELNIWWKKEEEKRYTIQLDSQSGQSPSNEAARRISGWETFFFLFLRKDYKDV